MSADVIQLYPDAERDSGFRAEAPPRPRSRVRRASLWLGSVIGAALILVFFFWLALG